MMRLYYVAFLDDEGGVLVDGICSGSTWLSAQAESLTYAPANYAGLYAEELSLLAREGHGWIIPSSPLPERYPENDTFSVPE